MSSRQPDRLGTDHGSAGPRLFTDVALGRGFLNTSRIPDLIISGCGLAGVVAAVAAFMPWAGATLADRGADLLPVSRTGLELSWNGSAVLGLGVLCAVISMLLLEVPRARRLAPVLPLAGLAITVLAALEINAGEPLAARLLRLRIGTFQTDNPVASADVGMGLWLSLVAGVVLVLGGIGWHVIAFLPRVSRGVTRPGDVVSSVDVAQ